MKSKRRIARARVAGHPSNRLPVNYLRRVPSTIDSSSCPLLLPLPLFPFFPLSLQTFPVVSPISTLLVEKLIEDLIGGGFWKRSYTSFRIVSLLFRSRVSNHRYFVVSPISTLVVEKLIEDPEEVSSISTLVVEKLIGDLIGGGFWKRSCVTYLRFFISR